MCHVGTPYMCYVNDGGKGSAIRTISRATELHVKLHHTVIHQSDLVVSHHPDKRKFLIKTGRK